MNLSQLLLFLENAMRGYYDAIHGRVTTIFGRLKDHVVDTNNPHRVSKQDVKLGLVQNYPIATKLQAVTGKTNMVYMTPLRTTEQVEYMLESLNFSTSSDVDDRFNELYDELADAFNTAADQLEQ